MCRKRMTKGRLAVAWHMFCVPTKCCTGRGETAENAGVSRRECIDNWQRRVCAESEAYRNGENDVMVPIIRSCAEPCADLEEHEADLDLLAEVAELVSKQSAQQQLLTSVLAALERRLGMLRGTVMLLLPDGKELSVEAAHGTSKTTVSTARYRIGEGVVGQVVETAQPAVIPRVSAEPRFQNRIFNRAKEDCEEVSFLCVPDSPRGRACRHAFGGPAGTAAGNLARTRARFLEIAASMISYDVSSRQGETAAPPIAGGREPPPPRRAAGTFPSREHHRQLARPCGRSTSKSTRFPSATRPC